MQNADKHSHALSCDQGRLMHVQYLKIFTK